MAGHLLIVAALLVATGTAVVGVCCWPALALRRRVRQAPVARPEIPAPPKRSDFTLTS